MIKIIHTSFSMSKMQFVLEVFKRYMQMGRLSLFISLLAVVYSCKGNKTADESLSLAEKNSNPVFRVTSYLPELEVGCDPYGPVNTVGICVWNYGAVPLYIKSIEAERIWFCQRSNKDIKDAVAIPINCYYSLGKSLVIEAYQGKLAEGFALDNNSVESACHMAFINAAPVNGFYFLTQFTLVKIEYTTIYEKECTEYFKDGVRISSDEYASIKALAPQLGGKILFLSTRTKEAFLDYLLEL